MDLALSTIIVDVALCVLIWIIQIVVYPGFCFYSEEDIKRWHKFYTIRITLIVFPLMLSQLVLYAISSYLNPTSLSIGLFLLVISTWIHTLFSAVPLHNAIERSPNSLTQRKKLVRVNWFRTIVWTLILIISLISYGE